MLQRMLVEILFLDPADVYDGVAELLERGFNVDVLDDWFDDLGPTMWIMARIDTDLDADQFFDFAQNSVPHGGDLVSAGPAVTGELSGDVTSK